MYPTPSQEQFKGHKKRKARPTAPDPLQMLEILPWCLIPSNELKEKRRKANEMKNAEERELSEQKVLEWQKHSFS